MNSKAFIIHLARAVERKVRIADLIDDCDLMDFEIVEAIDGKWLADSLSEKNYRRHRFWPRYPFALTTTEIACFLSHRICWQKIVDQHLRYGLIFEDDVKLDTFYSDDAIDLATRHIDHVGYIQLSHCRRAVQSLIVGECDDSRLKKPIVSELSCCGQLVSNAAAKGLLDHTKVFDRPVDALLQMHWITDIVPHIIEPSGLSHMDKGVGGSTIHAGKRKSLFNQVRRFSYRRKIARLSRLYAAKHQDKKPRL